MQISPTNFSYHNISKIRPAFCSTSSMVNGHTYQTTTIMRSDLDWLQFADYLGHACKNLDEVNVYDFACSDGSEAWSLAFSLRDQLGESAKKFKIKAYDIDPVIISKAVNTPCNVSCLDIQKLNRVLKNGYLDYAYREYPTDSRYVSAFSPKPFIKDMVKFGVADMSEKIDDINGTNNVIMCRNCLVYLKPEARKHFIEQLGENQDKIHSVVIGNLEKYYGFDKLIEEQGYKESHIKNVFVKK